MQGSDRTGRPCTAEAVLSGALGHVPVSSRMAHSAEPSVYITAGDRDNCIARSTVAWWCAYSTAGYRACSPSACRKSISGERDTGVRLDCAATPLSLHIDKQRQPGHEFDCAVTVLICYSTGQPFYVVMKQTTCMARAPVTVCHRTP